MKVVFVASAEADLKELKSYIVQQFGPDAWQVAYQKIKHVVRLIQNQPLAGKVVPELAHLGMAQYRQCLDGKNRIVYEIRGDIAYVHMVCDTRRDLQSLLMRRLARSS